MSENISNDVLEAARKVYFDRCDNVSRLAPQFEETEVIDLIARAIMAATLAERERLAERADVIADAHDVQAIRSDEEAEVVENRAAESALRSFASFLRGEA